MAILEVENEAEARQRCASDPSVLAGLNRWVYPIFVAGARAKRKLPRTNTMTSVREDFHIS